MNLPGVPVLPGRNTPLIHAGPPKNVGGTSSARSTNPNASISDARPSESESQKDTKGTK